MFLFGGVLGLVCSVCLAKVGLPEANIKKHAVDVINRPTRILSLVGLLVCWALFPLLTNDYALA